MISGRIAKLRTAKKSAMKGEPQNAMVDNKRKDASVNLNQEGYVWNGRSRSCYLPRLAENPGCTRSKETTRTASQS